MDFTLGNLIPGFVGGIVGGVAVNRISYLWQKRDEKKEEKDNLKLEYKRKLKAKLTTAAETITNEYASDSIDYNEFKKKLNNFSDDLTAITADAPEKLNFEVYLGIQDVAIELKKFGNFFFGEGVEIEEFDNKFESVSDKIHNLIDLIDDQLYDS